MSKKSKIIIDGQLAAGGDFPLMEDSDLVGGYRTLTSFDELQNIPNSKRRVGMIVCIDDGENTPTFWKLSNTNTFESFIMGSNSGNVPVYANEESVPAEFPYDSSDEYLVIQNTTQRFTEEEKYSMILETINILFKDVAKIKNSMFSHMDLGTLKDSALSKTLRDIDVEPEEPIEFGDTGETIVGDDWTEVEEAEPDADEYFKISHLSIKSGTEAEYLQYGDTLLPFELFWLTDRKRLYIKQEDGTVYWLNRATGESDIPVPEPELPDMDNIESIGFVAPDNTKYKVTVNNDGELKIINETLAPEPDASKVIDSGGFKGLSSTLYQEKLYINSLYCGGLAAENPPKYQGCSHNFVELSNLTENDIPLNGLSLQYSINGTVWEVLPLKGIIKKDSTFLIRGAQCSVINVNTTKINVNEFDMEWLDKNGDLISFSNIKSKFCLTYGTEPIPLSKPYQQDETTTNKAYCYLGYVDMVGLNKPGASEAESIDASENKPITQLLPNRLFMKYFAMDPVKQATKAIGARNNANDWTWVQIDGNAQPNIEQYRPMASYENKFLFYNKTQLSEKPNLITVTFGMDAHKTRCFNWISKGYYDEYIWIKAPGEDEFVKYESFKENDSRITYTSKFYNRIRVVTTSGVGYTSHKFIITDLIPGLYEYKVGAENNPSDIHRFKVVAKNESAEFKFVQHSDQQGFNWNEYEPWRLSAEYIRKNHNPLFTINTGDMTQNGNRIHEWLDYYKSGEKLFTGKEYDSYPEFNGVEQMNCIGNNDLSPENFEIIDRGSDRQKMNSINFLFFFCYEMDPENPPIITHEGVDYYIPSLYSFNYNNTHFMVVNSEIPHNAQTILYGGQDVYEFMKAWCTKDLTDHASYPAKIAVMHEMPFTIITNAMVQSFKDNPNFARGGSRLNTETASNNTYWFSQLIESYGVQLCIGGHKHTYVVSHPMRENIVDGVKKTMQPIIQTLDPNFEDSLTADEKLLCEVEVVSKITAPVYTMLQATGMKLTSNKELPAPNTPWLKNYFPCTNNGLKDVPNTGQLYPFFIEWTVTATQIIGNVIKLDNIMTNGKFNINLPNPNPITPLNGNGSSNENIIIDL